MANLNPQRRDAMPRRSFFAAFTAAVSAVIGAFFAVPLLRATLFPLRDSAAQLAWSDLGPLESFSNLSAPSTQLVSVQRRDGWQLLTAQQTVYVVGAPGQPPRVLSSVCPHLGCSVPWRPEKNEFICPCHGGTYAADGSRISGPPARGLDELPSRVEDGRLMIQFETYRQLLPTKELAD